MDKKEHFETINLIFWPREAKPRGQKTLKFLYFARFLSNCSLISSLIKVNKVSNLLKNEIVILIIDLQSSSSQAIFRALDDIFSELHPVIDNMQK